MRLVARPIEVWPGELQSESYRTPSPFKASWSQTVTLLEREVEMLGADGDVVMQLALTERDCRMDGWIRADARPSHPGVLITFESRHGPLRYSTDEFTGRGWGGYLNGWQSNVRAIALGLEALRKVDRYGIARAGEQYKGWQQLPSAEPSAEQYRTLLLAESGYASWPSDSAHYDTRLAVRRAIYREALKRAHPDHGGTTERLMAVQAAGRFLGLATIELGAGV